HGVVAVGVTQHVLVAGTVCAYGFFVELGYARAVSGGVSRECCGTAAGPLADSVTIAAMDLRVVFERAECAVVINQRLVGGYELAGVGQCADKALAVVLTQAYEAPCG